MEAESLSFIKDNCYEFGAIFYFWHYWNTRLYFDTIAILWSGLSKERAACYTLNA